MIAFPQRRIGPGCRICSPVVFVFRCSLSRYPWGATLSCDSPSSRVVLCAYPGLNAAQTAGCQRKNLATTKPWLFFSLLPLLKVITCYLAHSYIKTQLLNFPRACSGSGATGSVNGPWNGESGSSLSSSSSSFSASCVFPLQEQVPTGNPPIQSTKFR